MLAFGDKVSMTSILSSCPYIKVILIVIVEHLLKLRQMRQEICFDDGLQWVEKTQLCLKFIEYAPIFDTDLLRLTRTKYNRVLARRHGLRKHQT